MPLRREVLATDEIYHVFNRSVANADILTNRRTLHRMLALLEYYRLKQRLRYSKFITLPKEQRTRYFKEMESYPKLVDVYTFALMPTHYHLLIKQVYDNGIVQFIANIQNSFAKFFNLKWDRHGALFQNPFKTKWVQTDEELLHISRYIHLNPVTSYLLGFEDLTDYEWTSFSWYMDEEKNRFLDTSIILTLAGSRKQYRQFVGDRVDYQRELSRIKRLILE